MTHLKAYAPTNAPRAWIWINTFCLVWSALLFIEILFTLAPLDRLEGTQFYLAWNFGTTFIWLVEVGLTIYSDMQESNLENGQVSLYEYVSSKTADPEGFRLILELMLAFLFLGDSITVFWRWFEVDENIDGELFDTVVSIAAYGYQIIMIRKSTLSQDDYRDIGNLEIT